MKTLKSEKQIIRKVIQGETNKFESLVEFYQKPLFSYLYRFLNQNRDDAEEVLQNTFLKAFQKLDLFDLNRSFRPWIFRIAHNEAANFLRSKIHRKEVASEEGQHLIDAISFKDEPVSSGENREHIIYFINQLPDKYKEVLVLYYFEDQSYEKIAEILNTGTATVGTLLGRAKKLLKIIMQ